MCTPNTTKQSLYVRRFPQGLPEAVGQEYSPVDRIEENGAPSLAWSSRWCGMEMRCAQTTNLQAEKRVEKKKAKAKRSKGKKSRQGYLKELYKEEGYRE